MTLCWCSSRKISYISGPLHVITKELLQSYIYRYMHIKLMHDICIAIIDICKLSLHAHASIYVHVYIYRST